MSGVAHSRSKRITYPAGVCSRVRALLLASIIHPARFVLFKHVVDRPPFTARIPYRGPSGERLHLVLRDCLILTKSEHNLISLGRLALDSGVGTYIAPGNQQSKLLFGDRLHGPGRGRARWTQGLG